MTKIEEVEEFQKDIKKIKFDLTKDLELFKKSLLAEYPKVLVGVVPISGLGDKIYPVYKARKFRCKAINRGSKSGIRIIYTVDRSRDTILLMEIYFKSKKEDHNTDRIKKYAIKK